MEKRYQVFISSTFQDLQNARQEVSQALLRADCFPAGMELFPAADEEQFEFIKTVIDQSDYYIIISAGRYGSIHPETGLSYTEMEYDYAVETGKPVIRLLHKDPFNQLKGEFIEQTDAGRNKLKAFREKMSAAKLVAFWFDEKELGREVAFALLGLIKTQPALGWVRSSEISSDQARIEIAQLRQMLAERELLDAKNETDLSTVLSELTGELDLKFNEMVADIDSNIIGMFKKTGRSTSVPIAKSALAKEICLSLLSTTTPEQIINELAKRTKPNGVQYERSRVSLGDHYKLIDFLQWLEGKKLVKSTDRLRLWELSPEARVWASGVEAGRKLQDAEIMDDLFG